MKAPGPTKRESLEPGSGLQDERYEVLQLLGSSPHHFLYEAADKSTGRRCAVTEILQDERTPQRFAQATRLQPAQHPFMARVMEVFLTDRAICIVAEPTEGKPLVEGEPIPPATVVPRILEILEPVCLLHEQEPPLVHGRIEPGTVLVDPSTGRARLGPPGLAPPGRSTPYDAPELAHQAEPEPTCDVFSIGMVLAHAFRGEEPTLKPLRSLLISAPELDLQLATIIDKAVATEPARRHPTAASLRDELRAWWKEHEVPAPLPEAAPALPAVQLTPEPAAPLTIPPPVLLAGAVLLCLVLVLSFAGSPTPAPKPVASAVAGVVLPSPSPSPTRPESTPELIPEAPEWPAEEPTPEPSRTRALPKPAYPVHHRRYPRATPRKRPLAVSTPVEVALRLARPDLGLALTVPEGWEVSDNTNPIELQNPEPTSEDPFFLVTIRVDTSAHSPSRIGRSFRLKKTGERWIELRDFPGADQAYLREKASGQQVEALVVHRLPYSHYRYVIVHLETREQGLEQAQTAARAGRWLENLQFE